MSNIFDPKLYKHVKSDKDTTTLRHKKGHEIKIAHNVIEPKMRAALEALSKIPNDAATESQKQESQDKTQYGKVIQKAKGGEVSPKYAAITEKQTEIAKKRHPEPSQEEKARRSERNKTQDQFMRNTAGKPMQRTGYDEGGRVPAPGTNTDQNDRERNLRDASQVTKTQTDKSQAATASDPSQIWNNIKNAWAKGGEVCGHCGQPHRKAMKDGGEAEDSKYFDKIHSQDNYGGGRHYASTNTDEDAGKEFDASEAIAKKTVPQEIRDESSDLQSGFNFDPQAALSMPNNASQILPQGRPDPNAMPAPVDPEKPILQDNVIKPAMNWATTDVNHPQPKPMDVAATTADSKVDALKAQEQEAQQVSDITHDQAAAQHVNSGPSMESLANSGYEHEQKAAGMQADAMKGMAEQQAAALQRDTAQKQDIQSHFQNSFNNLDQERQAHIADIKNGHIDPDQYWKGDPATGRQGHSKILSAIGIILSGFGAGLAGQQNAALGYINNQIDRNIDAQKQDLNNRNTLLNFNLHQFKNLHDAVDMSRVMQADVVKSQLDMAAAKAGTQLAAAANEKAQGEIDAKFSPIFMNLSMRRAFQNLSNGGTSTPGSVGAALSQLDALNPEQAKTYRERYYAPYDMPGGKAIADRPIDPKTREELQARDKFAATAHNLQDILKRSQGNINALNPVERNRAAQQALILQSLFREGTLGTVYREGEQPLLDKAVSGQPLGLVHYFTEQPKLQGLIDSNTQMKQVTLDQLGLRPPTSHQSQSQSSVNPNEGKTATGPNGQRIKMVHGKWIPLGQ